MQALSAYHTVFQNYLTENDFSYEPKELYEPVNYILGIGGKRLRPLLALMGCELFSKNINRALPIAMAVEVFHNFTLLHDDIMDDAPLRRGKPTVHVKYNINTGILSGDVMLILAYHFLQSTEGSVTMTHKLWAIFNKMAREVCDGQQMDMNFESRNDVTLSEYIKMIELKTSVLIAAAFEMGAVAGGASLKQAAPLYEFGKNVGIAFQIQDDLLDTFGDPATFGKKVGGDIVQNKKTFLVLKTFELANSAQKTALTILMATPTHDELAKITAVRTIFEALNVQQHAERAMDDYLQLAFAALDETTLSGAKKTYLKEWANELNMRRK
ncbi:MAG: polyprenyl synthetase family protein [Saprospiraceae bacterium]|nr:polyprenyl synthetase family protein [Saprospiraceae bacterium]